jgi:hypothetical protein
MFVYYPGGVKRGCFLEGFSILRAGKAFLVIGAPEGTSSVQMTIMGNFSHGSPNFEQVLVPNGKSSSIIFPHSPCSSCPFASIR